MAKLVGVLHEDEDPETNGSRSSKCLSRRQLPLTIESDLTMIMALDDACLACCSNSLEELEIGSNNISTFLRKYEALSRDEVTAALMVNFDDLMTTLSLEVACVGCRRSVEALLQKLYSNGDSALEPLVITDDKIISVGRDHILAPKALANLFCGQLMRLQSTYVEPSSGSKNRKKGGNGRCPAHSLGLGSKKVMTFGNWLDTWECMERECQEECVLVHFDLLRETVDRYLKKHSFCDECTKMVNKAYNLLVQDIDKSNSDSKNLVSGCKAPMPVSVSSDEKKIANLYKGLTSCVSDQHVHVECKTDFVSHLIEMAEPELSGLRQERHAKTIEIAQKEVLTCIGICLYERFQRIQQRLQEGQQACDLLFFVALKSLKQSFEMAFESKQGISDLEKLCQELDEEERKKQEKAQKKREKKTKNAQKKKKEKEDMENMEVEKNKPSPEMLIKNDINKPVAKKIIHQKKQESTGAANAGNHANKKPSKKFLLPVQEPLSVLNLASMLEDNDDFEDEDENENEIPQEEIQQYLQEVSQQREELRRNLRQRFDQLCVNGL